MRRGRQLFALPVVALALLAVLGCGATDEVDEQAAKAAEDWAWLQQAKTEMDGKRAELMELQGQIAAGPEEEGESPGEGEGAEAAAPPPSPEELATQAEALQQEVYGLADTFGARLAQFINDQGISVGGELTEMQAGAIRMKSDEDIELARDYIERGGEYQRAIDIYSQAMIFEPDYDRLLAAKADAETKRYMTEERMAEVKKNMTEAEVRALLGTPKTQNVREFEQGGVVGWFYPKEEPNTAAAVFFKEKKGEFKVYKTDFEAVKAPDAES